MLSKKQAHDFRTRCYNWVRKHRPRQQRAITSPHERICVALVAGAEILYFERPSKSDTLMVHYDIRMLDVSLQPLATRAAQRLQNAFRTATPSGPRGPNG